MVHSPVHINFPTHRKIFQPIKNGKSFYVEAHKFNFCSTKILLCRMRCDIDKIGNRGKKIITVILYVAANIPTVLCSIHFMLLL